jgi:hypothetical protein
MQVIRCLGASIRLCRLPGKVPSDHRPLEAETTPTPHVLACKRAMDLVHNVSAPGGNGGLLHLHGGHPDVLLSELQSDRDQQVASVEREGAAERGTRALHTQLRFRKTLKAREGTGPVPQEQAR